MVAIEKKTIEMLSFGGKKVGFLLKNKMNLSNAALVMVAGAAGGWE